MQRGMLCGRRCDKRRRDEVDLACINILDFGLDNGLVFEPKGKPGQPVRHNHIIILGKRAPVVELKPARTG